MQKRNRSVLLVEDEVLIAADLNHRLTNLGYRVLGVAATAADALRQIACESPDVVLLDVCIRGEMDGIMLADHMRERCHLPVILLIAQTAGSAAEEGEITERFGYAAIPQSTGNLAGAIEIALYKHAVERKQLRQKSWLEATLRSVSEAIVVTDAAGAVCCVNDAACTVLGLRREQCLGREAREVLDLRYRDSGLPVEDITPAAALEETPVRLPDGLNLRAAGGARRPVMGTITASHGDGQLLGAVIALRDVAQCEESQKRLREEQSMIALGHLAEGVSRELQTSLGAIRKAGRKLARKRLPAERAGLLIGKAAEHGLGVMRQLMSLSRYRRRRPESVDLCAVLREEAARFRRQARRAAMPVLELHRETILVRVDRGALVDIARSLLRTGARGLGGGGRVTVTASQRGDAVGRIVVRDGGPALETDVREHPLEPFGMTEDLQDLGLAVLQPMVSMFGGRVLVSSHPGEGTTLEVELPLVKCGGRAEQDEWPTILLVNSSDTVLRAMHNYLEAHRYNMLEARDGEEAREVASVYEGEIAVLVVVGKGAAEVVRQVRRRRAGLKALVVGGEALANKAMLLSELSRMVGRGGDQFSVGILSA